MDNKKLIIKKEDVKIEDGKVKIDSEELSNLIQNQDFDCLVDEEAGSFINVNINK
jgi:hypothetical protein